MPNSPVSPSTGRGEIPKVVSFLPAIEERRETESPMKKDKDLKLMVEQLNEADEEAKVLYQ